VPATIDVTLYTDPGCPWAYSALPALRVLEWRYDASLRWRLVVIGLAERAEQYLACGVDALFIEALRDPEKRKAYDQLRARGYRPGDEVRPPPGGFGGAGAGGVDFDEIFAGGGAGGGFSDFFEELFGRRAGGVGGHGGPGARGHAPRGDTRARLAVPLETVYRGDSVRVPVLGKTFDVRIPKGIRPGQVVRLPRQGQQGGDLLLEIEYAAHPDFEVDGRNIIHSPWDAALGATLSVATLGGRVELKIPPGSEAGRKLRLRGRGLPGAGGAPAGDQLVELEIQAPPPRTAAQTAAYEALRDAFSGEA